MNKSFWRVALVAGGAWVLTACGNKETRQALDKSSELEKQKQYTDANQILVDALQAREAKIRAASGASGDPAGTNALIKKVKSDSEILKMERAQIPLYLRMERPDMASAVYADVLAGHPGDTYVYDALKDKDPLIRIGAVRILGLMATPESIDPLVAMTKDNDQDVRRSAVAALAAIKDPKVVPPLIAELKDSFWFARSEAANALADKHDASAIKPLLDAVADNDKTVSESAQNALVVLSRAPNSVARPDDFAARLNDPNAKVKMISAVCLAMLKDVRSLPVLESLISSNDPTVRLDAVKGLGESGDPSVLPTLRQTLKDPDLNMRGWSIIGLGNLKDGDSLIDLEHIATDDTQPQAIRAAASAAVNKIKSALPPLENP